MDTLYLDELSRLRASSGTPGGTLLQPYTAKDRASRGPQNTSLERRMIPRPPVGVQTKNFMHRQGSTSDVGAMAQEMVRRATQLSSEVSSIRVPLPSEAVKGAGIASKLNEEQVKGTSDKGRSVSSRRSRMDRLPGWRMRARSRSRLRTKQSRPGKEFNDQSEDVQINTRADPSLADLQTALRPVPLAPGAAALRPGASAAETCWQACLRGTATAVAPPSGRPKSATAKPNARSSTGVTRTTSGRHQQAKSRPRPSTARRSRRRNNERAAELTPSRPYGTRTPGVDAVVTPERRHAVVRWAQSLQGPSPGQGGREAQGKSGEGVIGSLLGTEERVLGNGVSSQWVPRDGGAVQLGLRPASPCDECDGPVLDGAGTEFVATSPAGRRGLLRRRAAELQDRVRGSELASPERQSLKGARGTQRSASASGSSRPVVAKGTTGTRAAGKQRRPRAAAVRGRRGKGGKGRNTHGLKKKKGGRKRRRGGSSGTVAGFLRRRRGAEAQALRRAAQEGGMGGGGAAGEGSLALYGAVGSVLDDDGGLTGGGGSGTGGSISPLKDAQRARAQHRLAYTVSDGAAHLRRIGSAMGVDVAEEAPFAMTRRTKGSGGGYGGLLGAALEAEGLRRRQSAAMQTLGGEGYEGREGRETRLGGVVDGGLEGGAMVELGRSEGGAMVELGRRSAASRYKQQQQQLQQHSAAARGRAAAVVAELMAGSHQVPLSSSSQINSAVPDWERMVQAGALLAQ